MIKNLINISKTNRVRVSEVREQKGRYIALVTTAK